MSQVLVLPPLNSEEEKDKSCNNSNDCRKQQQSDELKRSEQLTAALMVLMQQQQLLTRTADAGSGGNTERACGGIEQAVEIDATEALERRMKQMELSMPQKVEAMLDEGISEVKGAMGDLLAEVRV